MRWDFRSANHYDADMFCDLHMHTTASDGTDTPESLPRLVKTAGLTGFALTDHDTTDGLAACAKAAKRLKLAFIPGIELSANPDLDNAVGEEAPVPRGTMHILGYGIRHDDPQLAKIKTWLLEAREQRNPNMVARLNELGVRLDYDEVVAEAGGGVIGRPHIAQVMVRKGYVKSVHEAFARYIGEGKDAYTRKDRLSAADAIAAIRNAGGVAVLAHPVQLKLSDDHSLEHTVKRLKDLGLSGIETRHSDHGPDDIERFTQLAQRYHLLTTGGSDYHGSRKSIALGATRTPYEVFERLQDMIAS